MTLFFTLRCLFPTAVINTPTCFSDGSAVVHLKFEDLEHKFSPDLESRLPGALFFQPSFKLRRPTILTHLDTSKHELLFAFKCVHAFINSSLLSSLFWTFAALMIGKSLLLYCAICSVL